MAIHIEKLGREDDAAQNLVLIHGWGSNGAIWQSLVKKLGKHFALHLIDLPGAGMSAPIEPFHLFSVAEQVADILPANADLIGWSLGGQVAMRIALDKPDLIRRLVLIASTPKFVRHETWQTGVEARIFHEFADAVNRDYQKTMLQNITLQCMGAKDARDTIKVLRKKFEERPPANTQAILKSLQILLDTDLREEIPLLRKPTLLIHGDRDNLVPLQAGHWMVQHLPAGFLRVISGAAHAPFLSHQDQFVETLVEFLEPA